MTPRPAQSFAVKLTLLITLVSGLAGALVCGTLMVLEARETVRDAMETAGAHARVIAANSSAALDFADEEAARSTLVGLAAVPEFAAAQISTAEGRPFARYERRGGDPVPSLEDAPRAGVRGRWLRHSEPIVRDGERIGDVALLYDFAPHRRRLLRDAASAVLVTGAITVLSFLAARRLQRTLLRPAGELSRAAEAITSTDDYQIVARKYSNDELGVLTDVFNTMVGRIRDAETLRRNHQAMLEQEVARRTEEVLQAQARLRQSERMAALGTLSAGLGHDIGNILMPLRSHLASIRTRLPAETGEDRDDFEAIAKATEYLHSLSGGLRLLAKDPDLVTRPREATRLDAWWAATDPLLRAVIGSRIVLLAGLADGLPPVRISSSLLTQAVFNLVQNAAQAMAPEGMPPSPGATIRVTAEPAPPGEHGPAVRLAVSDNGPGMTEEVKRRCLEPYFTTKTRRISSGLGLALVKGITESVGGAIEVESAPDQGCTFTLILPAEAPAPARQVGVVVTIGEPRRRAVVSHLLTTMNCRVRLAGPGAGPAPVGSPDGEVWVTDSYGAVPRHWRGRVILLGAPPHSADAPGEGAVVVDPATPLQALREILRENLHSEADDNDDDAHTRP